MHKPQQKFSHIHTITVKYLWDEFVLEVVETHYHPFWSLFGVFSPDVRDSQQVAWRLGLNCGSLSGWQEFGKCVWERGHCRAPHAGAGCLAATVLEMTGVLGEECGSAGAFITI